MTYVSKKEKVFDLPDQEEGSSISLVRSSDHRLRIFPSVCERGSATLEECQKLQQLCGLLNGKESNGVKSSGFKYIPIDVLLTVLMAEKDAYIQELLERQEKCTCGDRTEVLFKAHRFDDSEDDKEALIRKDAEVLALKNRNSVLESELEECRDTLTKAMHKLENVETILNENICLNEKVKYADEMIKLLEENKRALELELRSRESGKIDLSGSPNSESWAQGDRNLLQDLYSEKNILKGEIEILQKELMMARTSIAEMESWKKQSETVLRNLQELTKENECFRKKLEAMKKLEKFVEDLRTQAIKLTEKYERECQRANTQMKQLNLWAKELQMLREERNGLQQKIIELSSLETQYYCLKNKLAQVELVIEENCALNTKMTQLEQLEKENDQLKSEIERLKTVNMDLSDSKNQIHNMEYELKAQENQIKALTSQIQVLSQEYVQQDEYNRLRSEIQEKTDIIMLKEEELKEIPNLKSQVEILCEKLQKCMDDLQSQSIHSEKLQGELDTYKQKCRELEEISSTLKQTYIAMRYEEKVEFSESVVHELEYESIPVLELGNTDEKSHEYQEDESDRADEKNLEESSKNRKLNDQNLHEMLERINYLKELLSEKDEKIRILESDLTVMRNSLSNCVKCQDLENYSTKLQNDVTALQQENNTLEDQLNSKLEEEARIEKLEQLLARQKKAVERYEEMLRESEAKLQAEIYNRELAEDLSKMTKEEMFLTKKEISTRYLTEIENLKNDISQYRKLADKLRQENKMLHKMKVFAEFTGKKALEDVLGKLRAELVVLQSLSKPELESECQALNAEVKRLVTEADDLKQSLEVERKSKDLLEKKLSLIQWELSARAKSKIVSAQTQTSPLVDQSEAIKKTLQEIKLLKEENEEFVREIAVLQEQCKDFQEEVTTLQENMDEMSRNYGEERNITNLQKDEINALNEKIRDCEMDVGNLKEENEELNRKSGDLSEQLAAKEAEIEGLRKELTDVKNEMIKLTSEVGALQNKESDVVEEKLKEDPVEKENSENVVMKVEKEFEELRRKLENCSTTEEKLSVLRTKRDNLIVKVNTFESEVDFLKNKLIECDLIKTELEQLKAERNSVNHLQMTVENEEKLLTDICGLREQLKLQQKEIEHAHSENTNLKEQLRDLGEMLEVCKKCQKTIRCCPSKADVGITASNLSMNDSGMDTTNRVDSSTSCEKLPAIVSIDEFKIEIAKMQNRHDRKVQKLKKGNAERIKKLKEQYEKESKNRNKSYNESLNNIKSYYESDIRKLVDRHKSSILRLQNLHEDEVQELNTNYETQMEAMQTLNENVVNDLTSGAAEKCKLTEKHNREIVEVEAKFQKLLKEKENQHLIEIRNLQNDLNRSANDLKEIHKEDIENLSRLYEENMAQIEEKHNKELKKCKKNNAKRAEMMKLKYEDLLNEERKKYEEQLQIMMERLKMGQKGDQLEDDIKLVYQKQKLRSEPTSEFNKILQKIITGGLEALKFDELMLIHCKTCFTTENFFEELNTRMEKEGDLIGDGCPHIPLLKEDKKQLLKRIFILEKEIAIKQLETHEAIISMETAEKCRIEELNALLRSEREKNAELKMLLTNQTRAQTDLKIESYMLDRQASLHETNFIEKVKELEMEKAEKRCLEEELQKEKNSSKHLNLLLENERQRFKSQRKKDSEYVEAMRMRLEEALSHEQIMESQLDYEAQFRSKLEFELQSLQRSFNLIVDQPQSTLSLESKMAKDVKNFDRFESEKEENLCKSKSRNKVKSHKAT